MMHDRYPFLGACNADLWDHNYTGADGHNVGVWEWDENIGNFGLTVSHYEVYVEGHYNIQCSEICTLRNKKFHTET